ncbi:MULTISPECIES: glycosyltransferase 61 family protein [Falsihalocynthiibacter]|uniref:glycosyltransferase 61 family protein n=1 Tax=Falsihalocynthiibacter TaxID=2854182 RepID=UPI0030021493
MTTTAITGEPFITTTPPEISGPHSGFYLSGDDINRNHRRFGLYDKQLNALPNSDVISAQLMTTSQAQVDVPTDVKTISDPVLFAGLITEQFGHILLNSIGRLWALSNLPENTRIVFLPKRKSNRKLYPHIQPILDAFGIKNEFIISKGPFFFEEIYTSADLFGERFSGYGTKHFFEWIDQKFPTKGPVIKGRKIYVTRSNFGPKYGRFACEEHLEKLLQAQGYEVFAPEQHSITKQVQTFQSAEKLIFAESSSLHLYSLICRRFQQVAIINRREKLPDLISNQLYSRPGPRISIINSISDIYWPPIRSDHLSVSLLDFNTLQERLVAEALIDPKIAWASPSQEEQERSLRAGVLPDQKMLNADERSEFLAEIRRNRKKA